MLSWSALLTALALCVLPGRGGAARRLRGLGGRPPAGLRRRRSRGGRDPLAVAGTLDLLAACLRAGLPTAAAVGAVGAVGAGAPEPLGSVLLRAAELLALGADSVEVWEQAAAGCGDEAVGALARMARRSARSGAGLATAVTELAEQRRGAVEDAAAARAERAGVLLGGPLGLCFLPAFLCLGIVPVVIGLAGHVLGEGLL
ncbi:type II secretion system F family protein [Nocardia sp. NPDC051030]|uniref:type II secretion system F family protein n=1 Tax=Nocardia sp. NPDC051030 TaxID=3155162 RepID=UPI00342608F4